MDIITKSMMTRENRLFRITSITFIFDRGKNEIYKKITVSWSVNLQHKFIYSQILTGTTFIFDRGKLTAIIVHLSVLPVALNCNFSQQTVIQLATYFGHNNNLDIFVLLSLARSFTSSSTTKNNERNSDTGKKNPLPATTIIRTKLKEQTSKLLPQAQIFQTLHETAIGKSPNTQSIVNISNPHLRAEIIISTNRLLITGQPVNSQNFSQQSMTQQVAPAPAKTYDEEYVQSLLDAQKTRFKNDWSKFLPQINNNNHEPSTVMEGGSQSGGFTQTPYLQYEPDDQ
jgi:hypothetical protein